LKILEKVLNALVILSMVSIGIGFVVAIWFNGLIGLKVISTSFVSMFVCMLVVSSLDVYR
jgi:hypothetical protein